MSANTSLNERVLLVGAGRMGSALAEGWLSDRTILPKNLTILDPELSDEVAKLARLKVTLVNSGEMLGDKAFDIVVIAVKPQVLTEVLKQLRFVFESRPMVVSVAAGKTIANIQSVIGETVPVVRMMPNTPAIIGRGVSVLCASADVTSAQRSKAVRLAEAVGRVHDIDDEALMDAVTAVSGSGPAYVFLLIEAMIDAGEHVGLPEDLARALATETVSGAALLAETSDLGPDQLRQNVTSPGGTTEAALNILMEKDAFKKLLSRAVEAATARGQELSSG